MDGQQETKKTDTARGSSLITMRAAQGRVSTLCGGLGLGPPTLLLPCSTPQLHFLQLPQDIYAPGYHPIPLVSPSQRQNFKKSLTSLEGLHVVSVDSTETNSCLASAELYKVLEPRLMVRRAVGSTQELRKKSSNKSTEQT